MYKIVESVKGGVDTSYNLGGEITIITKRSNPERFKKLKLSDNDFGCIVYYKSEKFHLKKEASYRLISGNRVICEMNKH